MDDPHIAGGKPHPLGDLLGVQLLKKAQDQHRAAALVQRQQQLCRQVTAFHHFGSLPGRPIRELLPVFRQLLQTGDRLLIPVVLLQPVFGNHVEPGCLAAPRRVKVVLVAVTGHKNILEQILRILPVRRMALEKAKQSASVAAKELFYPLVIHRPVPPF